VQKTCFLLGFMGSGKSFWGPELATRLGLPFVDLDALIENAEACSIAELFSRQGESEFRLLEQRYLKASIAYAPCVLATGGGTPCFFDNLAWMGAHGITIYLKIPAPTLVSRLRAARAVRPLLANVPDGELENVVEKMLQEREAFYLQSQIIVEPSDGGSFLENLVAQIEALAG